jgi:hypothetical protein
MMQTHLGEEEGLDELGQLLDHADARAVVPVQQRHVSTVRETSLTLAGEEDPLEEG